MSWNTNCLKALSKAGLFESPDHESRFNELIDCFSDKPFFTKGLCKCMYLSAWDEEHFAILLEMLSFMSLGKDKDTKEMSIVGDSLAQEQANDESYIYRLSISYLENTRFHLEEGIQLSERTAYVISRAQQAAAIIDQVTAE